MRISGTESLMRTLPSLQTNVNTSAKEKLRDGVMYVDDKGKRVKLDVKKHATKLG